MDATYFFTSLPNDKERAQLASKKDLKEKIAALTKEDLTLLEQLQYDRRCARV